MSSADPTPAAPESAEPDPPRRRLSDGLDLFYPIVPDVAWLKRLVPLGVRTVQLRIKDVDDTAALARDIAEARDVCAAHACQLIVNDHWRAAIEAECDYVHLGQEDLAAADREALRSAGVRLGISTHSEAELETALAADPDYVALGPIYETKLKKMAWAPQGLERLTAWKKEVGSLTLVGIAGITLERADGVIDAGADSVAVITDIVTHADPEARVRDWLAWADGRRPTPVDAAVRTT
ncbi:MAG: thiamine phosphate synthase [Pseudomonadota bacterium]